MRGIPPRELLYTHIDYSPYTEDQAQERVSSDYDYNLAVFELVTGDLIDHMLRRG
jgi:hypothetical protein